jgi:hypothetical protein
LLLATVRASRIFFNPHDCALHLLSSSSDAYEEHPQAGD